MILFKKFFICFLLVFAFLFSGCKKDTYAHTNSLIHETSPYLLKHAHNPVNWKPWSDSIFKEAEKQKKLIIVSIGYSSCHWCNVMEEETFSNDTVAQIMNTNFVSVKVDREERPDVDHIYMTALQLMKGAGGWPLNMILLPNGQPLYGGTYHTKNEWLSTIKIVDSLYKQDPDRALKYAQEITTRIKEINQYHKKDNPEITFDKKTLKEAISFWKLKWDLKYGGNLDNQKFMLPSGISYLLDYGILNNDTETLKFVELTLDNIALRGVYDHIEGGFFRYSTDPKWEVPHFEKMLYDNAQLVSLYSKAYKVFKKPIYRERIIETINFLNNKFKNESNVYQSALDADLKGEEGGFYTFSEEQITESIKNNKSLFNSYFNINSQNKEGVEKYHLFRTKTDSTFAHDNNIELQDLKIITSEWKNKLKTIRYKRPLPLKDDKIITSWNALTIEALADASSALGDKSYLDQAETTYAALLKYAFNKEYLLHSFKLNSKPIKGFLDDYAFLTSSALKLYSLTGNTEYLEKANYLNKIILNDFKVHDSPFFKYNSQDNLIAPIISINDGVLPAANAVMAKNLFQLSALFYNDDFFNKSKNMSTSMTELIESEPVSYPSWQSMQLQLTYPFYDIAITGSNSKEISRELNLLHLPNTLIFFEATKNNIPLFESRWISEKTLIYICEQRSCKFPVENVPDALKLINY